MKFFNALAILITALACWAGYSWLTSAPAARPSAVAKLAPSTQAPAPAAPSAQSGQSSENPFDLVRTSGRDAPEQASPAALDASFQSAFLTAADDPDRTEANDDLANERVPENEAASHSRMLRVLEKVRDENRYEKAAFGREPVSSREYRLALKSNLSSAAFPDLVSVAEHRLWLGDTRAAIAHLQSAQAILQQSPPLGSPLVTSRLLAKLGLASLRPFALTRRALRRKPPAHGLKTSPSTAVSTPHRSRAAALPTTSTATVISIWLSRRGGPVIRCSFSATPVAASKMTRKPPTSPGSTAA